MVENPPANAGDPGLIPGLGRREWQPTPVFLSGKPHGQSGLQAMGLQSLTQLSDFNFTSLLKLTICEQVTYFRYQFKGSF